MNRISIEKCCGCMACSVICSQNCIDNELDNGFIKAKLNNNKCLDCGLCKKVCPLEVSIDKIENVESYSGFSKDQETLYTCTSGGITYEICKHYLKKGYKICGVRYNYQKNVAEHFITDCLEELEQTKGSKYIPSFTKDAFKKLFDGNNYVVIGTPCQIAGIRNIAKLKRKEDKFVLIDFFCHGVPSYLLWDKYLNEVKQRNNIEDIRDIKFRSKKYGWHSFTLYIENLYSDLKKDNDLFYRFFLDNLCLDEECYTCRYRADKSLADIRVGDLWGTKYANDTKGVSGILVFNEKGKKILKEIQYYLELKEEDIETVIEGQIKGDCKKSINRTKVLRLLKGQDDLERIYNLKKED